MLCFLLRDTEHYAERCDTAMGFPKTPDIKHPSITSCHTPDLSLSASARCLSQPQALW